MSYPSDPAMGEQQVELWRRLCLGAGSIVSFFVEGGEAEAFAVLDRVRLMKLAVSLGGVESLIENPHTKTHSDMTEQE